MAALTLVSLFCLSGRAAAAEPEWREGWERTIFVWLKSLGEADVTVEAKEFELQHLDPNEMYRNLRMVSGYAPPLLIANEALKLPSGTFLWTGMWKEELPLEQASLRPYESSELKSGQIWVPSHPTTANLLGWLYARKQPWNPYAGDAQVARRAAIISLVDLLMNREQIRYYHSGEEGCRQPALPGPHTGIYGFSLTFNAFTFLKVSEVLPSEVREAWAEGLRWLASALAHARPVGPENMQLSAPTGIYYVGLALDDAGLKKVAQERMSELLAQEFSAAGYMRDAGVPDGSYNGISLHRLAEFWAISGSEGIARFLKSAYRLKEYLTLPEPNGTWISPSHFNARCQDGFDNDQYQGREVMFAKEVPGAALFLSPRWAHDSTPETVREKIASALKKRFTRLATAKAWGQTAQGARPHDWGMVLDLPYILYPEADGAELERIVQEHSQPVILRQDRYTENLGNEFFVVRRPAYGAIFYSGPATAGDDGRTNYGNRLKGEGGYLMGLAGGGLSAFWTPLSGSLLLGRFTGREGYWRKDLAGPDKLVIGGWEDWLNNQIVGETMEGKILSSSRTPHPRSRLSPDGAKLEIKGVIPNALKKQGRITDAEVSYLRTYEFHDDAIACQLVIETNTPLEMKSLYEAIPIVVSIGKDGEGPLSLRFLDSDGQPVEEIEGRRIGVKALELSRYKGTTRIDFQEPVTFAMKSVEITSRQRSWVRGRSFLIELPRKLTPGAPVKFAYRLTPLPLAANPEEAEAAALNTNHPAK